MRYDHFYGLPSLQSFFMFFTVWFGAIYVLYRFNKLDKIEDERRLNEALEEVRKEIAEKYEQMRKEATYKYLNHN